jgi:uncharacterized protein (TIGR02466 family)
VAKVELWFPVAIYQADDIVTAEQNARLRAHCLAIQKNTPTGGGEWLGSTYNTHQTHDLSNDAEFQPVLDAVSHHIHEFAKMHNCTGSYKNNYAWMNIAEGTAWQEFHTHNGNVFSAVYYVDAPEGSGKIIFEDPKEPDMFPIKTVNNKNQLSYSRISYTPLPGTLLIFRSYLRHCVAPGTNTDPRISIAMNFN